jgi:hypothetical protein
MRQIFFTAVASAAGAALVTQLTWGDPVWVQVLAVLLVVAIASLVAFPLAAPPPHPRQPGQPPVSPEPWPETPTPTAFPTPAARSQGMDLQPLLDRGRATAAADAESWIAAAQQTLRTEAPGLAGYFAALDRPTAGDDPQVRLEKHLARFERIVAMTRDESRSPDRSY